MEEEIDVTKLKYVLYARKSTDDPERQVRSIHDQIYECQILASRLGLHVISIIEETKSAKKPDQRPLFRQMLKDLKLGKYDGILSWNPDRLSRNMREAGEIIDMIDEHDIKDLKFVTQHFSDDANGKMLLGMAFVLSKQYSDDLSQKVTRGVRHNFEEGKTPAPKHGYIRTDDGYYRPEGNNFYLIKQAWKMRLAGDPLIEIVNFLNDNGYGRTIKRSGKLVVMTKQILSDIFRNPFYYGILIQRDQTVDLRELYNFVPAVSENDYQAVQQLSYRRIKPTKPHTVTFYPFRAMIVCSFCGRNMVVAPSTGHTGLSFLYFRCDNKQCTREKKSIRAKVVVDFIYEFLKKGLNFTEAEYHDYYDTIQQINDENQIRLATEIHSKQAVVKAKEREIKEISLAILKPGISPTVYQVNEKQVADLTDEVSALQGAIATLEGYQTDPDKERLSLEQFLNLSKNAAAIVKAGEPLIKDKICRYIFLNLVVDEGKVLSYQLKEPFLTLIKKRNKSSSRGAGN